MSGIRPVFPFSAIAGQEPLKRALVLNAVDPSIGGALIRGEKGTAKSTAVRALAALLPPLPVVDGCPFNCAPDDPPEACPWCVDGGACLGADSPERVSPPASARPGDVPGAGERTSRPWSLRPVPLVELPVSATEDRVAGSFNLEAAIRRGVRRFEPGLLAGANRGILYVDEVNLLPDHLVDIVLDAAAGGTHRVEREGISVLHAARFVLVGTMNPEEGELRPQLLDRFGLAVDVTTPRDPVARAAIVRRRIAFDADPLAFTARWGVADRRLAARIISARERLPAVQIDDALLDLITRICVAYEVDGLRADIVIYKGAAALAALDGRHQATAADVRGAAELALPHRRRRRPFDDSAFDPDLLDRLAGDDPSPGASAGASPAGGDGGPPAGGGGGPPDTSGEDGGTVAPPAGNQDGQFLDAAVPHGALPDPAPAGREGVPTAGRRQAGRGVAARRRGRHVASVQPRARPATVAFDATLRAAAPHQGARRGPLSAVSAPLREGQAMPPALSLRPGDVRERVFEGHPGRLLLFVVDASGSMAGRRRMALAKGAARALLLDAYRRRDAVGVIVFRGEQARLVLPPTNSVELADRRLMGLETGGRTPLAAALDLAGETIGRYARGAAPLVVLLTDGKANVARRGGDPWSDALRAAERLRRAGIAAAVIDADWGSFHVGLSQALAEALGGAVLRLSGAPEGDGSRPGRRAGRQTGPDGAGSLVSAMQRLAPPGNVMRRARWV